jgi:orotidine-5'-phosphate decarboxylase
MRSPVIVALDYANASVALTLVDQLDPKLCRVKVGKELFTREGPSIVKAIQSRGFELFLDLKFHDIPNTVASAVHAAADLGVWMVNVHASGGRRMMVTARERLQQHNYNTLLIAVTVLTSSERSDLADIGLDLEPIEQVQRLARLTAECGLDGVVCSAQEAAMLRQAHSKPFALVTPGIRPEGSSSDDQKRIMTPRQAVEVGVDYMVIGRPITQAQEPIRALQDILASL